jgi:hypothetical protein
MGVCKIGELCPKGLPIPVSWSLRDIENGKIVADGEVNSLNSTVWSKADVRRRIGSINMNRGRYIFKIEILRDVPDLAGIKTRVIIYHPSK